MPDMSTIVALLRATPAVTNIVGTAGIYPMQAPSDAQTPFIVYSTVSGVPLNYLQGSTQMDGRRVQIDCYAKSYSQAQTMAAAVRTALSAEGYEIFFRDDYEPDTGFYRVQQDWSIYLRR